MTSQRKIQANRIDAKASRVPKAEQSKSRVAKNAHRHALSISIFNDPDRLMEMEMEIDNLALKIAGEKAEPDIIELARKIARAQIELVRVRRTRDNIVSQTLDDARYRPNWFCDELMAVAKVVASYMKRDGPEAILPPNVTQYADATCDWERKNMNYRIKPFH